MRDCLYSYKNKTYPQYLKQGNGCRFAIPFASEFCKGSGLDIGAGKWPLPGAIPVDIKDGCSAENLPDDKFDYIFSSHCLEHLVNPVSALEHWKTRLKSGGVLFLYLPHPEMEYWKPQNCRKHLHSWHPKDMVSLVEDVGFVDVIYSERDLAWGYMVVAWTP